MLGGGGGFVRKPISINMLFKLHGLLIGSADTQILMSVVESPLECDLQTCESDIVEKITNQLLTAVVVTCNSPEVTNEVD